MRLLFLLLVLLPLAAVEYLSEAEALKACFPEADTVARWEVQATPEQVRTVLGRAKSSARAQAGDAWVATQNGAFVGIGYTDHVIGRTEYITWMCGIGADGRIRRMEVLAYREPIGGEVAERRWLASFEAIGPDQDLRRGRPIRNIAGSTMSVDAMTERARFWLDWHAVVSAPVAAERFPSRTTASGQRAVPVGTSALDLELVPATGLEPLVAAITPPVLAGNAVWNHWESTSLVAQFNRAGGGAVPTELAEWLPTIDAWHRLTNGAFDPTVGSQVAALAAGGQSPVVGWASLPRTPERLDLPPGVTLDFGGVMKGVLLDQARRAAEPLLAPGQRLHLRFGRSSHLVVGGTVEVPLEHPAHPGTVGITVPLGPGQALGAAHASGRLFTVDGVARSHLIDPRTGDSADPRRAAFVIAPSAALADVLDTACCLRPIPEALALAVAAGAEALLWDGSVWHATPGWPAAAVP